jgi:hypothetical protein
MCWLNSIPLRVEQRAAVALLLVQSISTKSSLFPQ